MTASILLVEDEDRNAALIRATLEPAGYRVVHVRRLDEARRSVAAETPSLVLLDLRLPDGAGASLAREIRAAETASRMPILAVSASVLESNRREALEAGCDEFIAKPISPRDLLARMEARLAAAAAAAETRPG